MMEEELMCSCGGNTFKVSKGGAYVLCLSCGKLERVSILSLDMDSKEQQED